MSDEFLLEARDVRKVFRGGGMLQADTATVAVDHFSLKIDADNPTFTTIAGESGSGKTTIARLLLGLVDPTSGEVRYRGRPLPDLDKVKRKQYRKEVQAIFQDPFEVYNPFYKVDHILTTPLKKFSLANSRSEIQDRVETALTAVGLRPDETLGRYPHQLSGGQRQRITTARALLLEPKLIIADEPVSMVDASLRATILESLHRLFREFGISFLYITHDLATAYQVSESLVVLYNGTVAEAGDTESIIRNPKHPYTQELIHSIPAPVPGTEWLEKPVEEKAEGKEIMEAEHQVISGCRYVHRCPKAMNKCVGQLPDLYQTGDTRGISCFLYEESVPVPDGDLTEILSTKTATIQD
ncbi:MAG: ABC transporter ATP-binding protein [Candidatus Latescibacterota bacterium]|nr:ABC transporter ATP-binding protein [Candidatus Latescibacterota bacterium]